MENQKIENKLEKFLAGLHLERIILQKINAEIKPNFALPAQITNKLEQKYRVCKKENKIPQDGNMISFTTTSDFAIYATQKDKKNIGMKIEATYQSYFKSNAPIDDEIFSIFNSSHLLLVTYPYFRYLVQDITTKMNLPPLILDLLQVALHQEKQEA